MKRLYPLLFISVLIYWSCEEQDTTSPTVTITFPQNNSSVSEMVSITCISSDNEGVEKVELWVNGVTTGLTDNSEPYSFDWNTTLVDNGNYTITIRSYDTSDNTTDSEPIVLTVDNTQSNPQPINITSVVFDNGGFTITWNQSTDGDFSSYELEKSVESTMGDYEMIYTTDEVTNTTYVDSDIEPLSYQYYRITVIDTFSYETIGQIFSSSLDPVPTSVNVTSVTYTLDEMTVEWGESSDGDFKDYKLLYSETESGDRDTLETYTDISTTSYMITEFDPLIENWYYVQVTDTLGLSSIGTGMTNEIDSPPTPSVLYPITYNDGYQISWSQNNDDDFQSYKLYESLSQDMSNDTLIYEIDNRTGITYFKTIQNLRYYQIVVEDVWGLQSSSNIEFGDIFVELWGEYYSVLNTTELDLPYNQLTGSIPPEIGNLTNLTYLSLYGNELTGEIPPEIGNLTNLTFLNLYDNQLTGSIPSEIGNLTNLTDLRLYGNQLTGSIPSEIGSLTNLTYLKLSYNQLTGSIPPEIGNLTNLNFLYLHDNQLSGIIPDEICNLGDSYIRLNENQLCPPYPSCISQNNIDTQDTSDCD